MATNVEGSWATSLKPQCWNFPCGDRGEPSAKPRPNGVEVVEVVGVVVVVSSSSEE